MGKVASVAALILALGAIGHSVWLHHSMPDRVRTAVTEALEERERAFAKKVAAALEERLGVRAERLAGESDARLDPSVTQGVDAATKQTIEEELKE